MVGILAYIINAVMCLALAAQYNKKGLFWFFIALVFGYWASVVLVVICLGDPGRKRSTGRAYNRHEYEKYDY